MAAEKPSSPPPTSAVLRSIDELRSFSSALSFFTRSWDDLQHLLHSINSSLDSLHSQTSNPQIPVETPKDSSNTISNPKGSTFTQSDTKGENFTSSESKPLDLDAICATTVGKTLRKYLIGGIPDVARLRDEVPAALARAADPARLVFNCLGGFYLQGKKAFADPAAAVVAHRRSSILALEFFLQSGRAVAEKDLEESLRKEAARVAGAWRSRLVREGGIGAACAVDALGLVLLVSAFGLPPEFGGDDMYDLLHVCNLKKKAGVLRKSPILIEKLPVIIQDLLKKNKHLAAAELVIAFGFEDKHPLLPLLSSFIKENKKSGTEERKQGQCSYKSLKEATEKELASVKSVTKFLADYKLDPKDFAGLWLDERVAKLEKEILDFDTKLQNLKRKSDTTEPLNKMETQAKIPKLGTAAVVNERASPLIKPVQEHYRILSDSMNAYSMLPPRYSYDGRFPGLLNTGMMHPTGNAHVSTIYSSGGSAAAVADPMLPTGSSTTSFAGNGIASSVADSMGTYRRYGDGAALGNNSSAHDMLGGPALASRSYMGLPAEMAPAAMVGLTFPEAQKSSPGTSNRGSGSSLYNFADSIL